MFYFHDIFFFQSTQIEFSLFPNGQKVHEHEYRLAVSLLIKLVSNWLHYSCLSLFDMKHVDNFI